MIVIDLLYPAFNSHFFVLHGVIQSEGALIDFNHYLNN